MSSSIRWGMLGTGNIARQFAAGVAKARRSQISAVASRSIESARAFAAAHNIPGTFGDYQSLLTSPAIDAVYIALPNTLHHEWTIRALEAGKHVLCEKPLAANARQAREMFDAAQNSGKTLVEAFMYRAHPLTHAVTHAVRSGAIGQLKLIRSSFCYRTTRIAGNIRFDPAMSGGALMDIGCYCISFSRLLAGADPISIHCHATLHPSGVDELAVGHLTFPGGILASFTCGMTVQADNTAFVCGNEGWIETPVPWKPPPRGAAWTIARGTPPRQDSPKAQNAPTPPRELHHVDAEQELYAIEADDFAVTLLDGKPPMMTPAESIGTMEVLDEMRRQIGVQVKA